MSKPGRRWLRLARKGWTCGVPYTRWDETHVRRCERRLTRLKKLAALILLMAVSVRAEDALPPDVTVDMTRAFTGTTTNGPSDDMFTGPVIHLEPESKPELFPRYLAVLSRYIVTNLVRLTNGCPLTITAYDLDKREEIRLCPHYPECLKWGPLQTNIQTNHVIGYLAPGETHWAELIPVPLWTNFGGVAGEN